jgi:MFS family permease
VTGTPAPLTYRRALPTLVLLAVVLAAGNTMMGAFSTVQEAARAELGLSDNQLGLLQGLAVSIPLALLSIPVGLAVDRLNRVRILFITSAVWTLGTALTAAAPSLPLLFVARMLAGLGANISTAIAISIAADLCLPDQRGRTLLLLTVGKYAGTALAFALTGWLLGLIPAGPQAWRSVHLALAGISAVVTAAILLMREPPRLEQEVAAGAPLRAVAGELWSYRRFLIPLFLGQTAVLIADASAAIWAAPILSRNFNLSPQQFSGWMGAVIFGSGVLGALIGGASADWGHRLHRRGGVLTGAVIASLLALPAALFPLAGTTTTFAIALFVLLLGGTITGLITATAIAVLLPNELRGLCVGSFIAIGGLIAFGAGPSLVAGVSSMLGGGTHLAEALAIVGTTVSVIGAIGFALAMRLAPGPVR